MGGLMLFQIVMFSPTQHLLEAHGLEHLTRIQYLVTALIIIATFIWHYGNKEKFRRYVFNTMTIVYLLIMGSIEIQHLFSNTFIITFVRGSIATALLVRGISHEKS
jgi:hypothetical protein